MSDVRRGPLIALTILTGVLIVALAVSIAVSYNLNREFSGGVSLDLADDAATLDYQVKWAFILVLGVTTTPLAMAVAGSAVALMVVLAVRWQRRADAKPAAQDEATAAS